MYASFSNDIMNFVVNQEDTLKRNWEKGGVWKY